MTTRSNRSKYTRTAAWTIATLVAAFALSLLPTPFYIIAPGKAVDLSTRVFVDGRAAPHRRFYLTDVSVGRASVLLLAARFWPGVRIVRRDTLVPAGETARAYDRSMYDAMAQSQNDAAVVAERAAGYRVADPPEQFVVSGFSASSRAQAALAAGDEIVRVGAVRVRRFGDLARGLAGARPGAVVRVAYVRASLAGAANVVTSPGPHGAQLGVFVHRRALAAALPVAVRYTIGDIAGSSGGLMFALEIYAGLRPNGEAGTVAGTGTIGLDGRVGRIEGVAQKLIATERAGITTFLVPRENYAEVAHVKGVRIIPVATFREALAAIGG